MAVETVLTSGSTAFFVGPLPGLTVLSPVNARDLSSIAAITQVSQFNAQRLAALQRAIADDFQGQINTINLTANGSRALRAKLKRSIDLLNEVVRRVTNIRNFTDSLLKAAVQAASGSTSSEFANAARVFDSIIGRIAFESRSSRFNPNLLAQSTQRDFTFRITEAGATQTVSGKFLAIDYTITDTGGQIWVRQGLQLYRTDATTGAPTGESAAIVGGIRLDSFTAATDTVTFTIAPDTADEQQFTGTLSRSGLGILDAFLYEGLETTDGRDRAISDIEEAKRTIDSELARYGRALTTAEFYQGRTDVNLGNFSALIDELTLAQAIELQEVALEINRSDALTATLAAGSLAARNELLNLLSPRRDPLISALINVLA